MIGQIFNTIFFFPILNLLIGFYKLFLFIKIPGALGFAIITMTMVIRLLFHPFFKQQIEMSRKMAEIKPQLDKLSEKYKTDQKKLQQEQLKLYQQAGINPASGCLVLIIQMPIFIALYQALYEPFKHGGLKTAAIEINKKLYAPFLKIASIDPWFLGLNLSLSPKQAGHWYYLLVPLLTAFLQYLQAQTMTPPTPKTDSVEERSGKTESVKDKNDSGDFQKAMNTQMKYLFPLMIGWFSYTLPIGLSIYWNVFSLFSVLQYRQTKKLTVTSKK